VEHAATPVDESAGGNDDAGGTFRLPGVQRRKNEPETHEERSEKPQRPTLCGNN
jgi:hypothetical protein